MTDFRIEIVADPQSGMVFAQALTQPGDELIVRSEPIYHSQEEAEAEVKGILLRAWPDRSPVAVDPSIGV